MTDNASSPSPSPFDKLPLELVKRIVDLVKEQEEAFKRCGLDHAWVSREEETGLDEVDEDIAQDTARGRWSYFYGRGVWALSVVSKKLRAATLPHLFETITLHKLGSSFFRHEVLGTPLCSLIKCIAANNPGSRQLVDSAWAMPLLPNLTSFSLTHGAEGFPICWSSGGPHVDASGEKEAARRSFQKILPALRELKLLHQNMADMTLILQSAPNTLTSLYLKASRALFSQAVPTMVEALGRFSLLETLTIDTPSPSHLHGVWHSLLGLRSITSLTIPLGGLGSDLLPFVEDIAPSITRLTLSQSAYAPFDDTLQPSTILTKLTHLRLEGHCSLIRLTHFFSLSPLRTLTFSFNGQNNESLHSLLPSFDLLPPSLRRLRCELTSHSRPRDEEAVRTALAERSISFELAWTPSADVLKMDSQAASWSSSTTMLEEEQRRAIKEDCEWASRHADWLLARGDKAGMQELAETVRRIRERRILEQQ